MKIIYKPEELKLRKKPIFNKYYKKMLKKGRKNSPPKV